MSKYNVEVKRDAHDLYRLHRQEQRAAALKNNYNIDDAIILNELIEIDKDIMALKLEKALLLQEKSELLSCGDVQDKEV